MRKLRISKRALRPSSLHLRAYNKKLRVLGGLTVMVEFKGQEHHLHLVVVKGASIGLLGRDWFKSMGIRLSGVHSVCEPSRTGSKKKTGLIKKYSSVFEPGLGTSKMPPVRIEVNPAALPRFLKPRHVPFALRPKVNEALDRGWNLNDYVPRRLLQAVCTAANLPYGDVQDEAISRINSGNNTHTISTLNRQCVSTYVRIKAIVIGEKNLDMTPYVAAPDDAIKRVVYNTYDIGTPEEVRQGFINLNPNIAALNARRIGKSRSILITFGEKKLPRQVFYWGSVFIVYPYRKRVETCYNIRKTAHRTDMCHKTRLKRCCRRGEGHPDPPEGELPAHKPKGIYFVGKKKNGGTTSPYDKKRRKEPPFTGAVDRMKNCIGGDSEDNKWKTIASTSKHRTPKAVYLLRHRDYEVLKKIVLEELRLSAAEYQRRFQSATKRASETWKAFTTRLRSYANFYVDARGAKSFEDLLELLVADQLKAGLNEEANKYVKLREGEKWFRADELARLLQTFEEAAGEGSAQRRGSGLRPIEQKGAAKGELNKPLNAQGSVKPRVEEPRKGKLVKAAQKSAPRGECFRCGDSTHYAAHCPLLREETKIKSVGPANGDRLAARVALDDSCSLRTNLREVKLDCSGKVIDAIVDTGADITVIRESSVPEELVTPHGSVELVSAFGEK
ncbi:hypothetical protein V5799_034108, partial [Amblyomma americanum]